LWGWLVKSDLCCLRRIPAVNEFDPMVWEGVGIDGQGWIGFGPTALTLRAPSASVVRLRRARMNHQISPYTSTRFTFLNCLFAKDFSHKKREPNGSLFLCLVVKGGLDSDLRPSPYGRLRRLSPDFAGLG